MATVLTQGGNVGAEEVEDDGEPFDGERMPRLGGGAGGISYAEGGDSWSSHQRQPEGAGL